MTELINYDESLLALISSVLTHYGVQTDHATLPCVDSLLAANYRNVVLMLFDGMGSDALEKNLHPDSFLRAHRQRDIASVFPPTTTAATITLLTEQSPIEHGWLGWHLYFGELNDSVCLFTNKFFDSGEVAADYNVGLSLIPYKNVFQRITEVNGASVRAECVSPFSGYHSGSVDEICGSVRQLCAEAGRHYIYTYWHQPDADMHDFGVTDDRVKVGIAQIDSAVRDICADLDDTLVIITADHGLTDTEWRFMPEHPELFDCLKVAEGKPILPSIESRATTFFIKEDCKARFETLFHRYYGDCYRLFTREEVFSLGLFGGGTHNPRSEGFIGDYLAVAYGKVSLDYRVEEKANKFKAVHAGLTAEEMRVPLIIVKT